MHDINEAVVKYLSEYPFWTDEAKSGLAQDIGAEGLKFIQEACDFASNQTALWLNRSLTEAWKEVQRRVRDEYPELKEEAIKRIVTIASYNWK